MSQSKWERELDERLKKSKSTGPSSRTRPREGYKEPIRETTLEEKWIAWYPFKHSAERAKELHEKTGRRYRVEPAPSILTGMAGYDLIEILDKGYKISDKQKYKTYKTVFQLVYENTTEDAEEAESRAIAQLKKLVGEKEANEIISRNYPVTTEMEK